MKTIFLSKDSNCLIVIPENAAIVEKTAAEELQTYIQKSLDLTLPVVHESAAEGTCIYVGHTAYAAQAGILGQSKEHWIIHMHNGNLILTGGQNTGDRGIIYAVYHFLEEFLGVRWFSPKAEDVLKLDSLCLDPALHKESTPAFPYRKPYMDVASGIDAYPHIVRSRVNVLSPLDDDIPDGVYDPRVRKFGDVRHMGRPHHVHVMGKHFPVDKYFDEHPDWWAWNEHKQQHIKNGHYCFSNEGFFQALLNNLLNIIREDVELHEKYGTELPCFYSLSLDDRDAEYSFCQCESCAKILREAGPSGYTLQFVNRIAREVAKVYPFARFETLAYVCFVEPPKDDTLPEPNVIVRLAVDASDMLHGIRSSANRVYFRLLQQWSALCQKSGSELYVWQYLFNIQLNYPLPLFHGLQETLRAYREYGVTGIFTETENPYADMHELNNYVLCRLMEDPDADVDAMVADFANRFYGKAGPYVKEYLDVLEQAAERNVVHVYCCLEDSPFNYIDAEAVLRGSRLLDRATEAVGEEQPYRSRLNWLRKPLDGVILNKYWDLKKNAEANGQTFSFDRSLLKARITAALQDFGRKNPCNNEHLGDGVAKRVADEIEYFNALPDEEEIIPVPECFRDVDPADIYQFPMKDMTKMSEEGLRKAFGFYPVEDPDSPVSKVMKVSYDLTAGGHRDFTMLPTSKDAASKRPIKFFLYQEKQVVAMLEFYKEDLQATGYQIYHVGTLKDIRNIPDSSLIGYDVGVIDINISGLTSVFPMDECDVYLSMKSTGEIYGGKPEEENAIFFDRLIIVRK